MDLKLSASKAILITSYFVAFILCVCMYLMYYERIHHVKKGEKEHRMQSQALIVKG